MYLTNPHRRRSSARGHHLVGSFILLSLLCTASPSWATQIFRLKFQGLAQTLNTGGSITLSSPSGVVVDSAGNTFIADTANSQIVEVNAQGIASVLTITGLSPALGSPTGIAIDGSGNLYIADTSNNRVAKVSSSGAGSVIGTGSVTLNSPNGVAVDQSGDVFIADTGNNQIVEVTSGGSASALSITVSSGTSTLHSPMGLAVDVSANLYIADSVNNRIVKVAAGSTTGAVVAIAGGLTLSNPTAVTTDRVGNLYIADTNNNQIAEVDRAGTGSVLPIQSVPLSGPKGVALDVFGTVYIADTGNNRGLIVDSVLNGDPSTSSYTSSLNKSAVGFGHVQLGSSTPVTLTLPFMTGSATGLGAVKVFTSGIQNLDFTAGTDTTCNSTTAASSSCSVQIKFLPTVPGLRTGAVVLYDTSLQPILTLPLYGWSDSPVVALAPNTGTVVSTGGVVLSFPFQLAVDGAGNIYDANDGGNLVKITAGGGSAAVVPPGSLTFGNEITGAALDGAGNLFISDHTNSRIIVLTPGGTASVLAISGLATGLNHPTALAFDGAGNLYISDWTNGRVVEVSSLQVLGSTSTGIGMVIGTGSYVTGSDAITGVAVDWMGNIYIPDGYNGTDPSRIIKVTSAGVVSLLTPTGFTFSRPRGVSVDGMGNIYVADGGNNRIVRITTAGIASVLVVNGLPTPASLGSPFGVTVDPSGNLYIPDSGNNRVLFVNVSGAALAFPSTKVGVASTAKTATVTNIGNQPLIFSTDPTYTLDFSVYGSDTNPCTINTTLPAGTLCDVPVNFSPQSIGSISAGITVTNNTLNVASSTQQVSVSGTGTNPGDNTASSLVVSPAAVTYGQTATLTATVTDTTTGHTATTPTGSVTFTDTIGSTSTTLNGGSPKTLSAGTATLAGVVLTGVGTHTITANYTGVTGSFMSSTASKAVVLSKAAAIVAGSATSVQVGQSGSVVVTVTSPYATTSVPTGTLAASILNATGASVASGTLPLTVGTSNSSASIPVSNSLPAGTYIVTISYSGDSNFLASTSSVTITLTIGKAVPTIALASTVSTPVNTVISTNPVAFTAAVASTLGTPTGAVNFYDGTTLLGSATLVSGKATITTSALAVGVRSITAVYAGDVTFATVTSSVLNETVLDFSVGVPSSGGTTGGSTGTTPGDTATTTPGGVAAFNVSVLPGNITNFPNRVDMTVSGLPAGATYTLTPDHFDAGATVTAVVLTVHLPTQTAELRKVTPFARGFMPVLAGMLLLPFGQALRRFGKKRVAAAGLLLMLSVVALFGLVGCGGSASGYTNHKTYVVTITATSGSLSHNTDVTLIVN